MFTAQRGCPEPDQTNDLPHTQWCGNTSVLRLPFFSLTALPFGQKLALHHGFEPRLQILETCVPPRAWSIKIQLGFTIINPPEVQSNQVPNMRNLVTSPHGSLHPGLLPGGDAIEIGRGTENRTPVDWLKASYSTTELYPHCHLYIHCYQCTYKCMPLFESRRHTAVCL